MLNTTAKTVTTFLLLTDPQIGWYAEQDNGILMKEASDQNAVLNTLATVEYPPSGCGGNFSISCSGLVGKPDATFIAGDLVNYGGHVNLWEQWASGRNPATYQGGDQLANVSALYDPQHPVSGITQLTEAGPIYFGLGNHELQYDCDACFPFVGFNWSWTGTYKDFYRYQMFNFISQMHTGYKDFCTGTCADYNPGQCTNYTVMTDVSSPCQFASTAARFPIAPENIDSAPEGSFDFKKYSLNYVVDLGPADVYMLHLFLGDAGGETGKDVDTSASRASGLEWLKTKLAAGGYARPVMIVQHEPLYAVRRRHYDEFMNILLPYNVIAVLDGHLHRPDWPVKTYLWPSNPAILDAGNWTKPALSEVQPGSVHKDSIAYPPDPQWAEHQDPWEYFGLLRVETRADGSTHTNVLYGNVSGGQVSWHHGVEVVTPPPPAFYVSDIEVVSMAQRDESSQAIWSMCTEMSGKSPNLNDGFGGDYLYVRPVLTTDPAEAVTGIRFNIAENTSSTCTTLFQGPEGLYRCLEVSKDYPAKAPITKLSLLRSGTQAGVPAGMAGMTDNLNTWRNGAYLYLVWATTN